MSFRLSVVLHKHTKFAFFAAFKNQYLYWKLTSKFFPCGDLCCATHTQDDCCLFPKCATLTWQLCVDPERSALDGALNHVATGASDPAFRCWGRMAICSRSSASAARTRGSSRSSTTCAASAGTGERKVHRIHTGATLGSWLSPMNCAFQSGSISGNGG